MTATRLSWIISAKKHKAKWAKPEFRMCTLGTDFEQFLSWVRKPAAHCSLGHRDVAEQSGRKKRFGLAALFPKSQTGSVTCSGKGNVVEYPWARSVPKP